MEYLNELYNDIVNNNYFFVDLNINENDFRTMMKNLYGKKLNNNSRKVYDIHNNKIVLLKKNNKIKSYFENDGSVLVSTQVVTSNGEDVYFENSFLIKKNKRTKTNIKSYIKELLSLIDIENNELMKMYR